MDTFFQWPQDIGALVREVENYKNPITSCRPPKERALNCPRCKSNNTKFCYYNNYSVSQPRYLCKTCKRYWTEGGILRNVPMGGASRKTKKSSHRKLMVSSPMQVHDTLNSSDMICNGMSEFFELNLKNDQNPDFCSSSFSHDNSMPVHNSNSAFSSSGFYDNYMDDIKPSSSFSHDGLENNGYGNNFQENIIFPFEELNPCDYQFEDSTRCWIGMVNGGSMLDWNGQC